jgi:hypothetical protein
MDEQHPFAPSPELVAQWLRERPESEYAHTHLAAQAARWGADQELEACCAWVEREIGHGREWNAELHSARRPKPPSLNSIALQMLGTIERDAHYIPEITDTIRRALEALSDD